MEKNKDLETQIKELQAKFKEEMKTKEEEKNPHKLEANTSLKELFLKHEKEFDFALPYGEPIVASAIIYGTEEILFENKILYGSVIDSEKQKGIGHIKLVDPDNGINYLRWRASKEARKDIDYGTTKLLLLKVQETKKKDLDKNSEKSYFIKQMAFVKSIDTSDILNAWNNKIKDLNTN